jgi:uncharacterized membrane protein
MINTPAENPTQGVIGEAWRIYRAQWRHLWAVAVTVAVAVAVIEVVLAVALGRLGVVLSAVVSVIAYFWLQGALVEAVRDVRDGRVDLTVGDTFARVRPRLGSLIGAGLVAGIAIAIGLVLLIVPGLVLLTWWAVLVPVVVLEQHGPIDALGRSRALVRGNGWGVFGVILVTFLIVLAADIVLSLLFAGFTPVLGSVLKGIATTTVVTSFAAIPPTLLYLRLSATRAAPEPV